MRTESIFKASEASLLIFPFAFYKAAVIAFKNTLTSQRHIRFNFLVGSTKKTTDMLGHTNKDGFYNFLPFECYDSTHEQKNLFQFLQISFIG